MLERKHIGMIFTKDVSNAYEIGTKKRGEDALNGK